MLRYLLLICLLSFLFAAPSFYLGVPSYFDLYQHLQFANTIEKSIASGEVYPNWAAEENEGYGGVGLRFYPPLSHYVLAICRIAGGNWFAACYLAILFWTLTGAFGVYLLAREWLDDKKSFVAAALFIFLPWHASQIYIFFLYSEYAAGAILPFCFLFLTRLSRNGKAVSTLGFAAAYAALILTHLPTSIIVSLTVCLYALFSMPKENKLKFISLFSGGVLLGLAATAFQWVRVAAEFGWLSHSDEKYFSAGVYDYRQKFPFASLYVRDFKAPYIKHFGVWFFDNVYLATIFICVPLIVIFYRRAPKSIKDKFRSLRAVGLFGLFMFLPVSIPVWDNVVLLQRIQFPTRWLVVILISLVILAAAGWNYVGTRKRYARFFVFGLMGIGFLQTANICLTDNNYLRGDGLKQYVEPMTTARNQEYWQPIWVKKSIFETKEKVLAGARQTEILDWQPKERIFKVSEGEKIAARLAIFYYPHWNAEIDGQPARVFPDDEGAMRVELPESGAVVHLKFVEPPINRFAAQFSLAAWIVILFLIVLSFIKQISNGITGAIKQCPTL